MACILVIGRHQSIMNRVLPLLRSQGHDPVGVLDDAEALRVFQEQSFGVVVLGGGVGSESRAFFHAEFPKQRPGTRVVDTHPDTILEDIAQALDHSVKS